MSWMELISAKYKIEKGVKFLIFDKKKILSSPTFLVYLKSKNIKYRFIDSLSQLSNLSNSEFTGIIFSETNDVPNTIKKKFTYINVNSFSLPFDISEKVYNLVSPQEFIQLVNYLTESDLRLPIDVNNYEKILFEAKKREYENIRDKIITKINVSLENHLNYKTLLSVGEDLGFIEYNDYKYKIDPFILSDHQKQSIRKYILSPDFKNVFFELPESPKTVDKIIPFINSKSKSKIALICFDCMGFSEWYLLKEFLSEYSFVEHPVFALIPTITSISRKAIFGANHTDVYLKNESDSKLFKGNFSKENDVCLFTSSKAITEDNIIGYNTIGKIYNMFDDMAHSIIFSENVESKTNYFNQILAYLKSSSLEEDMKLLRNNDYKIYFCSDHGNVLAIGNGTKIDKWLVEESAKRSYITDQSSLISDMPFDKYEIPFVENKFVILAGEEEMFNHKNSKELVHGGISLSELVVPFIEVKL